MTLDQMNEDLAKYDDFERVSDRVPYWERRFALTRPPRDHEAFDAVVAKHAKRVLGIFRAG